MSLSIQNHWLQVLEHKFSLWKTFHSWFSGLVRSFTHIAQQTCLQDLRPWRKNQHVRKCCSAIIVAISARGVIILFLFIIMLSDDVATRSNNVQQATTWTLIEQRNRRHWRLFVPSHSRGKTPQPSDTSKYGIVRHFGSFYRLKKRGSTMKCEHEEQVQQKEFVRSAY